MTASNSLTTGLINDFKVHAVWQVICSRIEPEYQAALGKAIDSPDLDTHARAGGMARAYETVLGLPDRLLKEVESELSGETKPKGRRWYGGSK